LGLPKEHNFPQALLSRPLLVSIIMAPKTGAAPKIKYDQDREQPSTTTVTGLDHFMQNNKRPNLDALCPTAGVPTCAIVSLAEVTFSRMVDTKKVFSHQKTLLEGGYQQGLSMGIVQASVDKFTDPEIDAFPGLSLRSIAVG
jgi:hypothetical protein